MRKLALLLIPALLVLTTSAVAFAQQQAMTLNFGPGRNEATATGTVALTDIGGGKTRVEVKVQSANANMPAHIHADTCPGAGPVVFPLTNVQNGASVTEINASPADIMARGKSVNLHKSPQEVPVYVACVNLPAAAAAPAAPAQLPRTGGPALPLGAAALAGQALLGAGFVLRRR
ncbi:MAG: hypothetical protein HY691_00345 [Chloroflexi bacterium]|nr:hypothetical protein [Chloroflexota bacterium]